MRRVLLVVLLVVACATGAAADSYEDAVSAYDRGDYTRAGQLLRPLAEQRHACAQINLGLIIYAKGRGVSQDLVRAQMWFTVSAEAMSSDEGRACLMFPDDMASRMTSAQIEKG